MSYTVKLIDPDEKDAIYDRIKGSRFYTSKADIYGICVKLYTCKESTKIMWEDNFYAMSDNVRSHARVFILDDSSRGTELLYEPLTKTSFLYNFDYYGWIKSVALAMAGDILEDEHDIHSVHGAALDVGGRGVTLIAPSRTGKTTQAWGLLRMPQSRLVTDDWYFVRLSDRGPLAFGSEKNCYIDSDIGEVWNEYQPLVDQARFDNRRRAIVDVRWVAGLGAVIPMTSVHHIMFLKRDRDDPLIVREMDAEEAWYYLEENDLCNPHQMTRDHRKMGIRERFFRRYLQACEVHMVNTTGTPQETQSMLRKIILGSCEGGEATQASL
ncbi:MAG TPA: hypothetical protein HA366_03555 [Candidatus Methanomethylophilaceae archaeon]|nr:hypothetical protein [Candidatus Methanomethylophilaceae archaeon]